MNVWEDTGWRAVSEFCGHDNDLLGDRERRQLAEAAPEMARLLLKLEWSGEFDDCPACGSGGTPPTGRHEPDCDLVMVLRKAGVRP